MPDPIALDAKPITKNEIELERVRLESRRKSIYAVDLSLGFVILTSAVPLVLIRSIFAEIAGKQTSLTIAASVGLGLALGGGGITAMVTGYWKYRGQSDELKRTRERAERLERKLDELQPLSAAKGGSCS